MSVKNGTNPLTMAAISAAVVGTIIAALRFLIYLKSGEFSRMDAIEMLALTSAVFVGSFLMFRTQSRK